MSNTYFKVLGLKMSLQKILESTNKLSIKHIKNVLMID